MATVSVRGKTRKERIEPDAFGWQIDRMAEIQEQMAAATTSAIEEVQREIVLERLRQEAERRNIHVLAGHSFDRPLGDVLRGTARVTSTRAAVEFEVDLPDEIDQPSYMQDTIKQIRTGRAGGISPGFMVPPRDLIPDAETLEPEPGNPSVQVRVIRQAVLTEISVVTRPAYSDTGVDVRAWIWPEPVQRRRPRWR